MILATAAVDEAAATRALELLDGLEALRRRLLSALLQLAAPPPTDDPAR